MRITDLDFIIDPELAATIVGLSVRTSPSADGFLYRQGDPPDCLYYVQCGEVLITLAASHREITFRAGPASMLGIAAVVGCQPYAMSARCSSEAEIFRLPCEAFKDLLDREPKMRHCVLRILAAEVRAARKALASLASVQ